MIKYQGFGAIREVPGSAHLLTVEGLGSLLTDCGIKYSKDKKTNSNSSFQFNPEDIFATCFTHAHADHMGRLFDLVQEGYQNSFFSTPATKDIIAVQLKNQSVSERFRNMEHNSEIKGKQDNAGNYLPFKQLQLTNAVQKDILDKFKTTNYQTPIDLTYKISAEFFDAGHIPGSSQILYSVEDKNILMCFDLGRTNVKTHIVNQPTQIYGRSVDYVFIESTYGKRWHDKQDNTMNQLEKVISTANKKNQRVICGAFSIMRTQLVLYDLFKLSQEKKLPDNFKIYLDSPTALEINKIIKKHPDLWNAKTKKDFANKNYNPFNFPNLEIITGAKGSQGLHNIENAHMVISASGMFDMGRIKRHVYKNIEDSKTVFLITGYQAEDSLGRILKDGRLIHPRVEISIDSFDPRNKTFSSESKEFDFKAKVKEIKGYSGHSDAREIANHLACINNPKFGQQFKGIFIVHGDYESNLALEKYLKSKGFQNTIIPELGREYELK